MKTFVIGDIHGGHKALVQCLERSGFDKEKDRLISLGDIADGWTEVAECFEELLSIKNLVVVRGNHDQWLKEWLTDGREPDVWTMQGGKNTIASYEKHPELKEKHLKFLKSTKHYFVDEKNNLYVHGGYDPRERIDRQKKMDLMWSRDLWHYPDLCMLDSEYKNVFVGHTTVWRTAKHPVTIGNVCFMDTGGGWEGVLSMLDVDTGELFQSDLVANLYPDTRPR